MALSINQITLTWYPQTSLRIKKLQLIEMVEKTPQVCWTKDYAPARLGEARRCAVLYTCLPTCEPANQGKVK